MQPTLCRPLALLALLALAGGAAAQQPAQRGRQQAVENILAVAPRDAAMITLVTDMHAVGHKLEKVAGKLHAPRLAHLADMYEKKIHQLKGVDRGGAAALLAVATGEQGRELETSPAVTYVLPVKDYDAFLQSYDARKAEGGIARFATEDSGKLLAARKGDYAVVTQDNDGGWKAINTILASKEGYAGSARAERQWLAGQDLAVIFPRLAARKIFTLFAELPGRFLDNPPRQGRADGEGQGGARGEDEARGGDQRERKLWQQLYTKTLKKTADNVDEWVHAVRLDGDDNVFYVERTYFTKDGPFAATLKNVEPSRRALLGGIPDRPYAVAMGLDLPKGVEEALDHLTQMAVRRGLNRLQNPDLREKVEAMAHTYGQLQRGLSRFAVVLHARPDSAAVAASGVIRISGAESFIDRIGDWLVHFEEVANMVCDHPGQKPEVKQHRVQIDDLSAVRLDWTFPGRGRAGAGKGSKELSVVTILAPLDPTTVGFACAKSADEAEKLIRTYSGQPTPLTDNRRLRETASMLPEGAHMVFFLDPRQTCRMIQAGREQTTKAGQTFPETPPIGYAARAHTWGTHEELVIPFEVIQGMSEHNLIGAQGGQGRQKQ